MDPGPILALTGISLYITGLLVSRLPVEHCPQCPHCREADAAAAERQRELRAELEGRWGIPPRCPGCGRRHEPGDD